MDHPRSKTLATAVVLATMLAITACSDSNADRPGISRSPTSIEIAVIGDVPYGSRELEKFPALIESINNDPFIGTVVHIGDIKSGSSECTDEIYLNVYELFFTFTQALIYAIGDNEWTDCHRFSSGSYNPIERLAKLREIFFSQPGLSLGGVARPLEVQQNYPENQRWSEAQVIFSALHIVGSNNNLESWFGNSETQEQRLNRLAEFNARNNANIGWLQQTFSQAIEQDSIGVVLFLHADMWKPYERDTNEDFSGYTEFVQVLARLSEEFGKPVYIISGDSHLFRVDTGVPWFAEYLAEPVANVTQIVLDRSIRGTPAATEGDLDTAPFRGEWLRLAINPEDPDVFSWELIRNNSL